ncbi:MAG: hypothetical protein U9Q90_02935 [Campylobacterota bacterium]|nr:hypothetical protein [Campylobacterota bacterium]
MKYSNYTLLALTAATTFLMTGCDSDGGSVPTGGDVTINYYGDTTPTDPTDPTGPTQPPVELPQEVLAGDINADMTLTKDKLWVIDGLVVVHSGATLTIEPGTTIAGLDGTGDSTSYMIVDKGAKILAEGTSTQPIVFTSAKVAIDGEAAAVGQWGGLTIIGNAGNDQVQPYEVNTAFVAGEGQDSDNSGVLRHVKILNSGITMEQDKEINGLSFVGVGSGTTVEDITVDLSDDDGVEIWGGTVNLTNVTITRCTDDYFDIDDGYNGTVKNLIINTTTGNAGIEMSGNTAATFDGFDITTGATQKKEGGIYFKKDGIGGYFKNGTVTHNGGVSGEAHGAIHSKGAFDTANTSFENVIITAPSNLRFTGDSAAGLESEYDSGSGNQYGELINGKNTVTIAGNITQDTTLTKGVNWLLDGLVVVYPGTTLTIQSGTTIAGLDGTGDATSYMIVDKDAKIIAEGTAAEPIVFTSAKVAIFDEAPAVGQWGGLTIIGNAGNDQVQPYEVNTAFVAGEGQDSDNSGVLRHVKILNSGITMEQDKEINGLSFVGVGSGTTVEDITVDLSDDDGVEIWGGTVNLTNVTITRCTDDYFDIDDGYNGTVKNLIINTTTGNAGIEMSGNTAATFDGFDITTGATQKKEGGIYFKKDGIGGYFKNGTVTHNGGVSGEAHGAIHSKGAFDTANTSFTNVTIAAPAALQFTGDSAAGLETAFNNGTGNSIQ